MPLPIVRIPVESDLRVLVQHMRQAAVADHLKTPSEHSATPQEAIQNAAPFADEILSEGRTRILQIMPSRLLVSLVLTVDALPGTPKVWHLSAAVAPSTTKDEPGRIPDDLARRFSIAFETPTEGPPEGVFKHVRHFRGPYRPE